MSQEPRDVIEAHKRLLKALDGLTQIQQISLQQQHDSQRTRVTWDVTLRNIAPLSLSEGGVYHATHPDGTVYAYNLWGAIEYSGFLGFGRDEYVVWVALSGVDQVDQLLALKPGSKVRVSGIPRYNSDGPPHFHLESGRLDPSG